MLSSESDKRGMQVELATARKEAAAAAAQLKHGLANWQVCCVLWVWLSEAHGAGQGGDLAFHQQTRQAAWRAAVVHSACMLRSALACLQSTACHQPSTFFPSLPACLPSHASCLALPVLTCLPACLQSELDMHKGEANRLKREMERVEGERERVREEARK